MKLGWHVLCGEVRNPFLKAVKEDTLGPGKPRASCGEHSHNLQWPVNIPTIPRGCHPKQPAQVNPLKATGVQGGSRVCTKS